MAATAGRATMNSPESPPSRVIGGAYHRISIGIDGLGVRRAAFSAAGPDSAERRRSGAVPCGAAGGRAPSPGVSAAGVAQPGFCALGAARDASDGALAAL